MLRKISTVSLSYTPHEYIIFREQRDMINIHTKRYDKYTYEVTYDEAFEQMILDFEKAIGGTIYRPTAKKILNNWFSWAVEQRSALINLISRKKMNYSYLLFNEK